MRICMMHDMMSRYNPQWRLEMHVVVPVEEEEEEEEEDSSRRRGV